MNHQNSNSRIQTSDSGFALLEIGVVFMVSAIVIAFALPVVSGSIRAYNLRSAANHLAERISAVRALALAKNKNVTFSFNNESGMYGFDFTGTVGDGVPDTYDPDNPGYPDNLGTAYYPESLPSGIRTTFPGNAPIKITFNSRGEMPIGGSDQNIVLQNDRGSMTVAVNLRGKIAVQ